MIIEKKVWPEYFKRILLGEKTFEVRLADWECKPGDTLTLKEWDPKKKEYTGRSLKKEVKYVLKTKDIEKFWSNEEVAKYGFQIIAFK